MKSTQLIRFVLPVLSALAPYAGSVAQTTQNTFGQPGLIEVFNTADSHGTGEVALQQADYGEIVIQSYELNGIKLVEAELSYELTADPEQSKSLVLQRIQTLSDQTRARMQRSAIGLAKAMQYGVDRVPAIVFDGQAVLYGMTDLQVVLAYYQAWRTRGVP